MSDPAARRPIGKVIDSPIVSSADMVEPPSAGDAERSVLGAMILDAEQIEVVLGIVGAECFLERRNRLIFEALVTVYHRSMSVDFTTIAEELRRKNLYEEAGGVTYLAGLEQYVFSTSNAPDHARLVRQKHQLRELIHITNQIREEAMTQRDEVEDILDRAEMMIFQLNEQRTVKDFQNVGDLTLEVIDEIDRRASATHDVTGVATGYADLDEWTGGLQRSDLIILAARPSVGKTAFALNMTLNIGAGLKNRQVQRELQRPVGIFSLEMSARQVNMRLLSTLSNVPMHAMRTGRLRSDQKQRLHQYAGLMQEVPVFIDDTASLSILDLRAKARRLVSLRPDLGIIFIDYLQLMRGSTSKSSENRQQEVSEISRSLKALARELNVPVVALSQLSRQIEQRKGKHSRPMLSDLRESGAIEQDADVVMFLHREKSFDRKDGEDEGSRADVTAEPAELIIGKQRNGPIGTIDLVFFRETATYHTLARGIEDGPGY